MLKGEETMNFTKPPKNMKDRRKIALAPGVVTYVNRRRYGSDWLHKGFADDRRSGVDRRVSNN